MMFLCVLSHGTEIGVRLLWAWLVFAIPSQCCTGRHLQNVDGIRAGYRKQVKVDGVDVLLLWYKNKIYAIEAR